MMCMWCCGQVYLLLSCCPCEGRLSGIVDVPNACATLAIPTAIFDQVCLSFPRRLASVMTLMIVRDQPSVLMCKGLGLLILPFYLPAVTCLEDWVNISPGTCAGHPTQEGRAACGTQAHQARRCAQDAL